MTIPINTPLDADEEENAVNAPRAAQALIVAQLSDRLQTVSTSSQRRTYSGFKGPSINWPGGEALVAAGRLEPEDLIRIAESHRRSGLSYEECAAKLKLLNKEDLLTASGIDQGYIEPTSAGVRIPKELIVLRDPKSKVAEQYRAIRTRLLTMRDSDKLNLFSLVELSARSQRYVFAANLAFSFAQIGLKTTIVDGDLRHDRLRRFFSLPKSSPTLLSSLHNETGGEEEVPLHQSFATNLSLLPAGRVGERAQDYLASGRLKDVLTSIAETQDIVLVVSAPFGRFSDGRYIWAATERTLTMVRRHKDRLHQLRALHSALRQVGAETLGAVITA